MEFQELEEAGALDIEYDGDPLDLYSFGIVQLNIQYIVEKVALYLLTQEGLLGPSGRRIQSHFPTKAHIAYPRFIRAVPHLVEVGSLSEVVIFAIATVMADPNVVAVMQNLAANVIWAIGESGVHGILRKISPRPHIRLPRIDPFDIGSCVREIIMAVAENSGERQVKITFRHRHPSGEVMEAIVVIGGDR